MYSPHKGQWGGALMFSLSALTNGWANNRDAGDLRRHCPHYDVTVMWAVVTWQGCEGTKIIVLMAAMRHTLLYCIYATCITILQLPGPRQMGHMSCAPAFSISCSTWPGVVTMSHIILLWAHWGLNKMADILHRIFWDASITAVWKGEQRHGRTDRRRWRSAPSVRSSVRLYLLHSTLDCQIEVYC